MGHKISFEEFECPPETMPGERPPRERRMLMAQIRGQRFGQGQAMIRNISTGGLGATTRQWIAQGDAMEVELPVYGWMPGHVAWVEGERFGLAFDDRIDPNRVTRKPVSGMDPYFHVDPRHRNETSAKRPAINRH